MKYTSVSSVHSFGFPPPRGVAPCGEGAGWLSILDVTNTFISISRNVLASPGYIMIVFYLKNVIA